MAQAKGLAGSITLGVPRGRLTPTLAQNKMTTTYSSIAFIVIIAGIFVYLDRRKASAINCYFNKRSSQMPIWLDRFPLQAVQIEKYLRHFCASFGVPDRLWDRFAPDDNINIYYDKQYTRWSPADCLEHADFLMGLDELSVKPISHDAISQTSTLGDIFRLLQS